MIYKRDAVFWQLIGALTFIGGWTASYAKPGDMTLTVPMLDSQVVLRTSAEFGGGVSSLVFRNKEHIDRRDHGRLLQSASSYDGYGGCFNPTEGGAGHDPKGRTSSQLIDAYVKNNQLWTLSDMGFWLKPWQAYPGGCGIHKKITQAVNTTEISGHLLEKEITVGIPKFGNVIEHKVSFHVPTHFSAGTFEASTGYMPKEFSLALFYDPVTGTETSAGNHKGEQSLPVILATQDRNYAMGVYSNQLPQNGVGYGRFSFPDVNKWNCVFREKNVLPKIYQYTCLIILGNVDEVERTMQRLQGQGSK
ncbi:hypothetical protein [Methylovulum miyakonense]|uniref:hypothetical protein n=1 Tax=Methylovulum miyakonense TaxID=645578 RepID=UPI00035DA932|nr:hypothetical protein [Methylovulum miyakonense]